jgi:hypothetical protein
MKNHEVGIFDDMYIGQSMKYHVDPTSDEVHFGGETLSK